MMLTAFMKSLLGMHAVGLLSLNHHRDDSTQAEGPLLHLFGRPFWIMHCPADVLRCFPDVLSCQNEPCAIEPGILQYCFGFRHCLFSFGNLT